MYRSGDMSLRTIKGKLIVLLVVLIVGFVVLGYQVTKSNNDGKMGAIRLTLINWRRKYKSKWNHDGTTWLSTFI